MLYKTRLATILTGHGQGHKQNGAESCVIRGHKMKPFFVMSGHNPKFAECGASSMKSETGNSTNLGFVVESNLRKTRILNLSHKHAQNA